MSRLYDFWQAIKGHYKSIIKVGIVTGGALLIAHAYLSIGKEVFNGEINGNKIIYEEGRFSLVTESAVNENRMTFEKDGVTYRFVDSVDETSIDWRSQQKPAFEKDTLEDVVIERGGTSREYTLPCDFSTIECQETQNIFTKANALYNDLRAQIREKLRSDYVEGNKLFVDSFKQ